MSNREIVFVLKLEYNSLFYFVLSILLNSGERNDGINSINRILQVILVLRLGKNQVFARWQYLPDLASIGKYFIWKYLARATCKSLQDTDLARYSNINLHALARFTKTMFNKIDQYFLDKIKQCWARCMLGKIS